MMKKLLVIEGLVVPDELAVPGILLDPAHSAGAAAEGTVSAAEVGRPEQMTVFQEVRAVKRIGVRLPGVDDSSLVVDEVRFLRVHGAEERVSREGARLVDHQSELDGSLLGWLSGVLGHPGRGLVGRLLGPNRRAAGRHEQEERTRPPHGDERLTRLSCDLPVQAHGIISSGAQGSRFVENQFR